jgi:hypothetical protein
MAIALYFDVHVDRAIVNQLQMREVETLTAQEDGTDRLSDESLLEHANQMGRPAVTHDIRFLAAAENWQRLGRPFCGLIFAHRCRFRLANVYAISN